MSYAAVVLTDNRNGVSSVDFPAVTDALLSGGVFLDETVLLPYDAPAAVGAALSRLSAVMDGVFVVCDRALLSSARELVSSAAGELFSEEYLLETKDCLFAALPAGARGAEIVTCELMARIDARRKNRFSRIVLRTVGAPAELMQSALAEAEDIARGRLLLHTFEKYGNGRIEVIYDASTPKMVADDVVRSLATSLKDYVYSMNDEGIAERLVDVLKLHRLRLATAESFTGGGVGREIVRVSGASAVFVEGLNTYAESSKMSRLGVREETLKEHGAASDQTAYEMAAGLLSEGSCDVAIATTGVAGPLSDGSGAPVGLCYLAVGTREKVRVFRFHLSGDRQNITETAVQLALFLAYRELN